MGSTKSGIYLFTNDLTERRVMSHPKKSKDSDLKYISEERKKEVERIFRTLRIPSHNRKFPDYSEGYNTPFKQFSLLRNEKIIFSSSG